MIPGNRGVVLIRVGLLLKQLFPLRCQRVNRIIKLGEDVCQLGNLDSQGFGLGPQGAGFAALGHVNGFMAQDSQEINGSFLDDPGLNPQGGDLVIPLRCGSFLQSWSKDNLRSGTLEGLQKFNDVLSLLLEGGR